MTTFSDRQPLYCQNTFYKKIISVYKLIINNSKISRTTQILGHNLVPHPSPMRKGRQTAPIDCFAVCFARLYTCFALLTFQLSNYLLPCKVGTINFLDLSFTHLSPSSLCTSVLHWPLL